MGTVPVSVTCIKTYKNDDGNIYILWHQIIIFNANDLEKLML